MKVVDFTCTFQLLSESMMMTMIGYMIVTITAYFSQDYLDSPSPHQAHLGGNQFPIFESVSPAKLLKQIYPVVVYTKRKRKTRKKARQFHLTFLYS